MTAQKISEKLNTLTNILVPVITALLIWIVMAFTNIKNDVSILNERYYRLEELMKDFKVEIKEIKATTLQNTIEINENRARLRRR